MADLLAAADPAARAAATAFLRITGIMLLLPGLGERAIPMRVRLAAAGALTAAAAPLMPPALVPAAIGPGLIAAEVATGAVFGGLLRMVAAALLVAGTIAAQATSLSQLFGAPGTEPSAVIGTVLHLAGLALAMAAGLHVAVVELIVRSWEALPPGLVLSGDAAAALGTARMGDAFALAVGLAAPFVVVSVLYNVTLGVLNKAMPQLMVVLVGAPAIVGLALAILALTAPTLLEAWRAAFLAALADPAARLR